MTPCILIIMNVQLHPRRIDPLGKIPLYPLDRLLDESQRRSERRGEEGHTLLLPEIER
jgi:hypothetical protein